MRRVFDIPSTREFRYFVAFLSGEAFRKIIAYRVMYPLLTWRKTLESLSTAVFRGFV